PTSRTLTGGDGIGTIGDLSANRTIAVDSTVVRTSGGQNIGGNKSFQGTTVLGGASASTIPIRVLSYPTGQVMIGLYTDDGSTQRGYFGFPSTTNNHLHILSNISGTN